ncbi:MAG: 50S ribosomal protein L35 [Candidatus Moranbacteria bacterium]|nr:50S ribosomal protein L35 [bacterium]MDP1884397.1 50S ribosomal protein L35 [Candidatus Moranbacteria bacterium]MDZ4385337.1 50S ribosomal protein L35 [Candidatus Moranbacteria bacterium]
MPKLKTRKAAAKRVKVTGTGKVTKRKAGQNHYNRKETGREGMEKKGDVRLFKADEQNMLRALPSKSSRR